MLYPLLSKDRPLAGMRNPERPIMARLTLSALLWIDKALYIYVDTGDCGAEPSAASAHLRTIYSLSTRPCGTNGSRTRPPKIANEM